MAAPPPPTPFHLLRSHHSPLSALHFNPPNTLFYSGDQDGFISILDLRVRRVICYWKAHEGGILGLEEWEGGLISHGRDNVIHFYESLKKPYISFGLGGGEKKGPPVVRSLPTNALNFCRFSLCPIPGLTVVTQDLKGNDARGQKDIRADGADSTVSLERKRKGKGKEREAIMAVPSLMDSELVDIYHLPSLKRIHASINFVPKPSNASNSINSSILPSDARSGLVMSLHLRHIASTSLLALGIGYEDGRVELHSTPLSGLSHSFDARMSNTPNPWKTVWSGKGHNEAVMGMTVDRASRFAWTVSADHRLVRYDFGRVLAGDVVSSDKDIMQDHPLKQIGNSSVTVNADGRVVAVGGWDGKIRLLSAETLKPLGTLSSHRDTVYVIEFANLPPPQFSSRTTHSSEADVRGPGLASEAEAETVEEASIIDLDNDDEEDSIEDEESEMDSASLRTRGRWFASGGKDTKVALWELMDFAAASKSTS